MRTLFACLLALSCGCAAARIEPTQLPPAARARADRFARRAALYVDAFINHAATPTGDGRFVFLSTREGMGQLYLADSGSPAAPPRRLETGKEPVSGYVLMPDGRAVIIAQDSGGDESARFTRVPLDGSPPELLTPGEPLQREALAVPVGRPDLLLFSARKRGQRLASIYVREAGGATRAAFSHDAISLADASEDGARALALEVITSSDLALLEADLTTGKSRRLYPPAGQRATIAGAVYLVGNRALVAVDDAQGPALVEIELASGAATRHPLDAAVAQLLISPRHDRVALTLNQGSVTSVRLFDGKTLSPGPAVKLPDGSAAADGFSPDGRQLGVTLSAPRGPADVFLVDASTGESKALRSDPRPGVQPMRGSTLRIAAHDGGSIPLNVYLPDGAEGRKLPTIVLVHGGPMTNALLSWGPCLAGVGDALFCRPYAAFLVSLGFAIVEPNIRGSTGFGYEYEKADNRDKRGDALRDVESVNRWARAQPWCDADRLVVFGSSYGGYMTLLALTRQPGLWRAGVDLFGPADLRAFLRTTDEQIRAFFVEEFGDLEKDAELLERYSPMARIDALRAPLFVYQGQNDPRVPRSESDAVVRAVHGRGVPVEYMVAMDEGHSLERRHNRIEFLARAARFLEEHLGLPLE